jgi:hypothetical protein
MMRDVRGIGDLPASDRRQADRFPARGTDVTPPALSSARPSLMRRWNAMVGLLVFSLTLLLGVLISELAHRSIISTAVLFLLAGYFAGEGGFGIIRLAPDAPVVSELARFALIAVLFTDALKVGWRDLSSAWQLPGRALLLGLPLTVAGTALGVAVETIAAQADVGVISSISTLTGWPGAQSALSATKRSRYLS